MNRQEIFNKVRDHLLEQGEKAEDACGCCVHETEDGLKCAIGILLPLDHEAFDYDVSVKELLSNFPDLKDLWQVESKEDITFLMDLQRIHDVFPVEEWIGELLHFEKKNF